MAKQHFYSAVPAKISMFHKANGFDTFACSDGVTPLFVKATLSVVDEIKISAAEERLIRDGHFSPCYVRYFSAGGDLVQSLVTYLPEDYTKERPGYFVHSLILSEQEKQDALKATDREIVNTDLFVNDIAPFRITDPDAVPNPNYPELPYIEKVIAPDHRLAELYDRNTVKKLLFAAVTVLSGKAKNLFILLNREQQQTPDYMIGILNTLYAVLPYHFREKLSFATRINQLQHMPTIRIKGVDETIGDSIPVSKGISVRLRAAKPAADCPEDGDNSVLNDLSLMCVQGVKEADFEANKPTVDFLYDLISDDEMRRAFQEFANFVLAEPSVLSAPSPVSLAQLIFLFRCGSGYEKEEDILPDDAKMQELFELYAKVRLHLPENYRVQMISAIRRYGSGKREIPGKIFTQVKKIYPTEPRATRSILLDTVLTLIHTNAMRDKLFEFVRANFSSEDAGTQSMIIVHLCSVFYGGFLQSKLLDFFGTTYPTLSEEAKSEILDKTLLTIRTAEIRPQLMQFLECAYGAFSETLKRKLYNCIVEHFKEGDELAEVLLNYADSHLATEPDDLQNEFADMLYECIVPHDGRIKRVLLSFVTPERGTSAGHFIRRMIQSGNTRLLKEYVLRIIGEGAPESIPHLTLLAETGCQAAPDFEDVLLPIVENGYANHPLCGSLSRVLAADESLPEGKLSALLREKAIYPRMAEVLTEVFQQKEGGKTVDQLTAYCKDIPVLTQTDGFAILNAYTEFRSAVADGKYDAAWDACDQIRSLTRACAAIGAYGKREIPADADFGKRFAGGLLLNYLQKGKLLISEAYRTETERDLAAGEPKEKSDARAEAEKRFSEALKTLIAMANGASETRIALAFGEESDFSEWTNACLSELGGRGKRIAGDEGKPIKDTTVGQAILQAVKKNGGFLSIFKWRR